MSDPRDSYVYEYTQTLPPTCYNYEISSQIYYLVYKIYPILTLFCKDVKIHLELTENGNIHCHGFLYPKNYRSFIKWHKKLREVGHFKINIQRDYTRWNDYCKKDYKMMLDIIKDTSDKNLITHFPEACTNLVGLADLYDLIDSNGAPLMFIDELFY